MHSISDLGPDLEQIKIILSLFLWERAKTRQNNCTHIHPPYTPFLYILGEKNPISMESKLAINPLKEKSGTKVKFQNILLSIYSN